MKLIQLETGEWINPNAVICIKTGSLISSEFGDVPTTFTNCASVIMSNGVETSIPCNSEDEAKKKRNELAKLITNPYTSSWIKPKYKHVPVNQYSI